MVCDAAVRPTAAGCFGGWAPLAWLLCLTELVACLRGASEDKCVVKHVLTANCKVDLYAFHAQYMNDSLKGKHMGRLLSTCRIPTEAVLCACVQLSGDITYNARKFNQFVPQRTSGYVYQGDNHIAQLTTRETLDFSARCQGPGLAAGAPLLELPACTVMRCIYATTQSRLQAA